VTESDRIAEVWRWWSTQAADIARSVDTDGGASFAAEMSHQVDLVHPDLQWEFGGSEGSGYVLCVTGAGVPELRSLTERWILAAPPADRT
jgi:hypothetical protein